MVRKRFDPNCNLSLSILHWEQVKNLPYATDLADPDHNDIDDDEDEPSDDEQPGNEDQGQDALYASSDLLHTALIKRIAKSIHQDGAPPAQGVRARKPLHASMSFSVGPYTLIHPMHLIDLLRYEKVKLFNYWKAQGIIASRRPFTVAEFPSRSLLWRYCRINYADATDSRVSVYVVILRSRQYLIWDLDRRNQDSSTIH